MKKLLVNPVQNEKLCISCFGCQDIPMSYPRVRYSRNTFFLHYVFGGEGYFCGKHVKCGRGFIIAPGQEFEFYASPNNPWRYFWVTLSGSDVEEICKKYIKVNSDGIFEFDFLPKLHSLIDMIFAEEGLLSPAAALGYFFLLMSYHEKSEVTGVNRYITAAKNYMKTNLDKNPTITETANALSISDRYLYNLFIKHEKISPKQYLTNLKISSAKIMLKNTNCTITEIASSTGFTDILAFSHFFKKNTGKSPSRYRKESF